MKRMRLNFDALTTWIIGGKIAPSLEEGKHRVGKNAFIRHYKRGEEERVEKRGEVK